MALSALAKIDVWTPVLDALARARANVPPSDVVVVAGSLSRQSVGTHGTGGSAGVSDASIDTGLLKPLGEHVDPADSVAFTASIGPDGTAIVHLVDLTVPALATTSPLGMIDGVALAPGTLPEPFRRSPAATHRPPSPGADPESVRRIVRAALPGALPAEAAAIEALQLAVRPSLPADVVALFETASAGELLLIPGGLPFSEDTEDLEEEPHGMAIFAPDSPYREDFTAAQRAYAWSHSATAVVSPDPAGRVQALGHSAAWSLIGADWGGGHYVVDLAPGPRGHYGQVLHVPRERMAGARWVAPSLTEFLLQGEFPDADPYYADGVPPVSVRVGDHTDETLSDVTAATEVLHINRVSAPVDLSPLAGHPRLRTLACTTDGVLGLPSVLSHLPALEYLELPYAVWSALVADGAVPARLAAAGFDGGPGDVVTRTALANSLLAARGRDPIPVTRIRHDGVVDTLVP